MQSARTIAYTAGLLCSLLAGCGTQIGNPTGAGLVRVTDNASSLSTLVNAAFLQTVDGMNMGDYGYSRLESRVSTDRSCETQAGSEFSLLEKAETKHSVIDESAAWYAKSDLAIKRSYQDAWIQNGVLLTCDPTVRAIRFNYERLQLGTVRLQSQVNEDLVRSLYMTEKKQQQELRHSLSFKKTGKRTLDFVSYTETGKEVILDAQLSNQVESIVSLKTESDGVEEATLQLQERFPLDFTITLDQSQQWTRYVIPNGRQEFRIPSSGEILRLEFRNLTFTRTGGCIPVSGQLAATVIRPNEPMVRYALTFQANAPLVMRREGGTDSLALAPFACVLKER